MSNRDSFHSTNITGKIRSSLVLKLNLRMMQRLIAGFMSMNILIISMGSFLIIWRIEDKFKNIGDINYRIDESYKLTKVAKPIEGINLPKIIQERLPLNILDAKRSVWFPGADEDVKLAEKIERAKYIIGFKYQDSYIKLEYLLGPDLKLFIKLFVIIFAYQILIIIGSMSKGSKAIRKTLRPLSDLTETAKDLNREVSGMGHRIDDIHIKNLAGAISSIDANKLDSHITVNSSQDELKDLASAINNMLNRINSSYQSQVRFVSDASHELRTPISVIQGYVNLLDCWGKEDPETLQVAIDAIKGETQSMKELVEQLLFLARGDNETIKLHREIFDACKMIEDIVHEMQLIDESHKFELNLDKPADIEADRQLIKQAIRIFVDNSIKYTPSGDKIILKVAKTENEINIVVQDNGIGISPQDLPNIFDRFYRSDESRARKTGGSGLGLSIAKWIIERHDAYLEILSREDIGTRITIIFPKPQKVDNISIDR